MPPRNPKPTPARQPGSFGRLALALAASLAHALARGEDAGELPELVELSPFVVTASDEDGYAARATIGGTRLRTELTDLGSQVDILSLQFLEDVAAMEPNEAFLYSLNVENESENPNYVDAGANANNFERRASGVTARGFGGGNASGASSARDFFATNLDLHGYNTGSVAISSGPNAILFGLGKPGGVVNLGLNQAETHRDSGRVQLRVDNWGSRVVTGDWNQVVLRDRLAVRVALLDEESERFFRPNFKDQERFYATVTAKPHPTLTARLHLEDIRVEETPDQWILPNDDASAWLLRGESTGSYHQNRAVFAFGDDTALDRAWPTFNRQLVGRPLSDSVLAQPGTPLDRGLDNFFYTLTPETQRLIGVDYARNNLWGTTQRRLADARITTATLDWNPLRDLHLQLGHNREGFDGRQVAYGRSARYRVTVDASATLPDGSPNPDRGRLVAGDTPWGYETWNEEDETRLTGAWTLDLADRLGRDRPWLEAFLGKHDLALLASRRESTDVRQLSWRTWADSPGSPGVPPPFVTNPAARANASFSNNYLANSVRGVSLVQVIDPGSPTPWLREVPGWDPAADTWAYAVNGVTYEARQFDPVIGGFRAAESALLRIDGLTLAWQGRFWAERLVATYGRRADDVAIHRFKTTASPDLAPGEQGADSRLQGGNFAWHTGLRFSDVPELEASYANTTRGIVFHPRGLVGRTLDGLSLFANASTNNDASRTSLGPNGVPNSPQTGEGTDLGFMLSAAGGRYALRVNWYETSLRGEETSAFGLVGGIYNLEERLEELDPAGYRPAANGFDVRAVGRNQVAAQQESESSGVEVTLVASPSPSWDLRFTLGTTEKVVAGIGQEWIDWLATRVPAYEAVRWFENGDPSRPVVAWDRQSGSITVGNPGDTPLSGWRNVAYKDGALGPDDPSLAEYHDETVVGDSMAQILASNGLPDRNVRGARANATVGYSFREGALDGLRIGGSLRWRDKAVVGFPLLRVGNSGVVLPDAANPYHGEDELFVDAMVSYDLKRRVLGTRLRFQANVRNVGGNDGPVVRRVDSQGVPRVYAFHEPRTLLFTVTATF